MPPRCMCGHTAGASAWLRAAWASRTGAAVIACIDIERMIDFYTSVFNLQLTDRGRSIHVVGQGASSLYEGKGSMRIVDGS